MKKKIVKKPVAKKPVLVAEKVGQALRDKTAVKKPTLTQEIVEVAPVVKEAVAPILKEEIAPKPIKKESSQPIMICILKSGARIEIPDEMAQKVLKMILEG
jgi:hypothetical protein